MSRPPIINGLFERSALSVLREKMPVPLGWIVLPYRLMSINYRRKNHGKWFAIISNKKKIFRVLRFAASLPGTNDNDNKSILIDWVGWIGLSGQDEKIEDQLNLKIRKAFFWEIPIAGLTHPEPSFRLSTWLAILSVILGLLSLILTLILA